MIRKIYSALTLLLIAAVSAVAQDATTSTSDVHTLTNKKGEAYLPTSDEWALGISASPFLGYLGNFMSGATSINGSPDFTYAANPASAISNVAVFGKKMIDANTAWRLRFNVGYNTSLTKGVVLQDRIGADPAYPAFAEDWQRTNSSSVIIAPGWEKRRGNTRLQGIYGGELVVGFSSIHQSYQYGNPMTADFPEPTTHDFGNNLPAGDASIRVTDNKRGSNFLIGARGFVGVEYFFVPKMSIGGEFGYMVAFRTQGRDVRTTQTWDGGNNIIRETKTDRYSNADAGTGLTSIGIGLDNLSGSINLLFYF